MMKINNFVLLLIYNNDYEMKNKFLWMAALALVLNLFCACSDDDEKEIWKELPTTPIKIDGSNATLTVNGETSTTGQVAFKAESESRAMLTLTDVVGGYPNLDIPVEMTPQTGGNSYAFTGSTTVNTAPQVRSVSADPALLTVDVNGTISTDGKVSITLTAYGAGLNLGTYAGATLKLTYSDATLSGKTVHYTVSGSTPVLTLEGIVPGEPNVAIEGVHTDQNGAFEGNATTPKGAVVTYNGRIETANGMTLALNVKLPYESPSTLKLVNAVAHEDDRDRINLTLKTTEEHAYYLNTSSTKISGEYISLFGVAGRLLEMVLKDVTFREDGNVIASYSSLPTGFDIKGWLDGSYTYQPESWLQSPINLANWYLDGENLYIIPNLAMILAQIEKDSNANAVKSMSANKTRAGDDPDLATLLEQWCTTGIRLTFQENPYKEYYEVGKQGRYTVYNKLVADYLIYLNQSDIKPLIPLLRVLINLYLTDEIVAQIKEQAGSFISDPEAIVEDLLNEMETAEKLEIGLCFNKN